MRPSPTSSPKPVICYLAHQLNPGGTERLVFEMAKALARDYSVLVCTLEGPGLYGYELRKLGLPVYPLWRSPGVDLNLVLALRQIWASHQVKLVHAHQYSPYFYAALTKYFYPGVKLLFEEHGRHYPETKKPLKNLFNRLLLVPVTNAFVAVSQEVRERLRVYEGIPSKYVRVIYNGIPDVPPLSPEERAGLRQKFGFSEQDVVAAFVGRLDPIKNLPLFLKALYLARLKAPHLKGLIIGDGPEREKLTSLARALNLGEACLLAGFCPDGARVLQAADLFVLPSFSEGTSLALLEAMAGGLPAVATAVGGNPEIIKDGQTGFLVPSNDVPALAAALLILAEDRELRQKMGARARRLYLQRFTFEKMLSAYRNLYENMLSGKG